MPRPGRLVGRTCLIVGGTSGIGLASARRFVEEGARIVVTGRKIQRSKSHSASNNSLHSALRRGSRSNSTWVKRALHGCSHSPLTHWADVSTSFCTSPGSVVGTLADGPLHECTTEGWERVMRINAEGAFLTNRAAVRLMLDQPIDANGLRGTVVNVGSVLDRSPSPVHFGTIAYAASKGAIRSMTLSAAARYAADHIRFNLLVPGLIDTPMAARATNDSRIRNYLATKQPIAAGPGSADDVAEAALYLCEPASRFVTGAELVVDGGWSIAEGLQQGEAPSAPNHSS